MHFRKVYDSIRYLRKFHAFLPSILATVALEQPQNPWFDRTTDPISNHHGTPPDFHLFWYKTHAETVLMGYSSTFEPFRDVEINFFGQNTVKSPKNGGSTRNSIEPQWNCTGYDPTNTLEQCL